MSTYVRWMMISRGRSKSPITDEQISELKERLVNEIDNSLKDDREVPKSINKVTYETKERRFRITRKLLSTESRKNRKKLGLDRQFACERLTPDHKSRIFMNPKRIIGLIVNPNYIVKEFKTDILSNSNVSKLGVLNPLDRRSKRDSVWNLHECIFDPRMKLDKPCFIGITVTPGTESKLRDLAEELSKKYDLPIKEVKMKE